MGVRFACHACGKPLHVKAELAGKRGICPKCDVRFRIPAQDSEYSIRLQGDPSDRAAAGPAARSPNPAPPDPARANPAQADSVSSGPVNSDPSKPDPSKPEPEERRGRAVGLLESEPESVWYVRPSSGGQYGPATSELLKQWIEEQRVASTALLWREGWPQWRVASEALPEWADRLPGPPDGTDEEGLASDGSAPDSVSLPPKSPTGSEPAARPKDRSEARPRGRWDVGATRRGRLSRRTLAVGLLLAISIALIVILSLVAFGPSMFTSGDQP